jgi:hypothetical protein
VLSVAVDAALPPLDCRRFAEALRGGDDVVLCCFPIPCTLSSYKFVLYFSRGLDQPEDFESAFLAVDRASFSIADGCEAAAAAARDVDAALSLSYDYEFSKSITEAFSG